MNASGTCDTDSLAHTTSLAKGPVFIVGMPRSGTKLLRDLLNGNPGIRIPRIETEFFPLLVAVWDSGGARRPRDRFKTAYGRVTKCSYFFYKRSEGPIIGEDKWYGLCETLTPAGIFEALMRHDLGLIGRHDVVWGDKSPSYIGHVALLRRHFPQAKFIHIVRDVRDYCVSSRDAWGKHVLRSAARWAQSLDGLSEVLDAREPSLLEVRYEDLLDEPKQVIARVCAFLGVPFLEDMLSLANPTENLGRATGEKRILPQNYKRYLVALTSEELASIESCAGDTMQKYGYTLTCPRPRIMPSKMAMLAMQVLDSINLVRLRRRELGTINTIRFYIRYFLTTHVRNQSTHVP